MELIYAFSGKAKDLLADINKNYMTKSPFKVEVISDDTEYDIAINEVCEHVCSGNCRRFGCNCLCGEFHNHETNTDKAYSWAELKALEEFERITEQQQKWGEPKEY